VTIGEENALDHEKAPHGAQGARHRDPGEAGVHGVLGMALVGILEQNGLEWFGSLVASSAERCSQQYVVCTGRGLIHTHRGTRPGSPLDAVFHVLSNQWRLLSIINGD